MVNTGKPSRGCRRCRERRIKCDEREFGCRRCELKGEQCPGYPDPSKVVFRSQNEYAKRKTAERDAQIVIHRPCTEKRSVTAPRLSNSAFISIENDAINHFFTHFVSSAGDWHGFAELPEVHNTKRSSPCLDGSLQAVALAVAGMQLHRPDILAHARQSYGNALVLLSRSVADKEQAKSDNTLAAVSLLGLFDYITAENLAESHASPHSAGQMTLMRLRGVNNNDSPLMKRLLQVIFYHMWLESALLHSPPPDDLLELFLSQFKNTPLEAFIITCGNIFIRWDRIMQDTDSFIHMLACDPHCIAAPYPPTISGKVAAQRLQDALHDGLLLDAQLQSVLSDCPPTMASTPILNPLPQSPSHPALPSRLDGMIDVYRGTDLAYIRNAYRSLRIHILSAMMAAALKLAEMNLLSTADLQPIWMETMNQMAAEICASIPYVLGDVDDKGSVTTGREGGAWRGYSAMWALKSVAGTRFVDREMQDWAAARLEYVGDVLGIGLASKLAVPAWKLDGDGWSWRDSGFHLHGKVELRRRHVKKEEGRSKMLFMFPGLDS